VTSYEGFYGGGFSALSPDYGNLTGYRMSAANLGFPGSPQSANQVQDVINAIKHGTKTFEVTMLQPDVAEGIPRQHFEEMRALMKLTGVKPSVHGPLIDAAGFGERGWEGDEGRADNERRLFNAIEQAQRLDPSGKLPFVVHAANGAPGTEWRPGDEGLGEERFIMQKSVAINRETGAAAPIKREYKFRLESPETLTRGGEYVIENGQRVFREIKGRQAGVLFDAEGTVSSINNGEWANKLTEVAQMTKHAGELIGGAPMNLGEYENGLIVEGTTRIVAPDKDTGKLKEIGRLDPETGQVGAYNKIRDAGLFMENAQLSFVGAFGQAYKYGTSEQKKELEDLSKRYSEDSGKIIDRPISIGGGERGVDLFAPVKQYELLTRALNDLQKITGKQAPQVYQLGEEFAMEKAAETFGNLAAKSYDKFKEKAPVLAIENMMQGGFAFSRAEDMKKLVEMSRNNFVEHLVEGGKNKKEAEKLAREKLGVTWDVGHLNLLRKTGFTEKDIVEQTKIISGTDKPGGDKSMVKHVHLTDNFGYADTHLVPGMGNVPMKAILEELEKTGRFDEMRKITEAGGMIQHFKKLPHSMTLAAFGSGIYGMKNGPTWGAAMDMQGSYFGGYGMINPSTHHSYFGAGFTTMPVELGGQQVGGGSRFGGTPMA